MNAADFLAAAARLPIGTLADVTGGGGLVVVAPHPDDESLGCGGLIAAAFAAGTKVRLIVVSDGIGSHPNSKRYPPPRLRELRESETLQAVAALGLEPSAVRFLRLPDRFVPIEGPEADAACEAILTAAREVDAGAICVTWRHDPHCDHSACSVLVDNVLARTPGTRVFSYPVWGWALPDQTEIGAPPRGLRVDTRDHLAAKTAAIAAHRSQTSDLIDDDADGFRLTPAMIARCLGGYEILLENEPTELRP